MESLQKLAHFFFLVSNHFFVGACAKLLVKHQVGCGWLEIILNAADVAADFGFRGSIKAPNEAIFDSKRDDLIWFIYLFIIFYHHAFLLFKKPIIAISLYLIAVLI